MSVIKAFSPQSPTFRLRLGKWLDSAVAETVLLPALGIATFLLLWSVVASQINTSLGAFPGPVQVSQQATALISEHRAEREKEAAFYQRQEDRNAKRLEKEPDFIPKIRAYTGKATYLDQIVTSILTVLTGFVLASLIAIPAGIVIGLSRKVHSAVNPLVQLFKPISPLAWLPLVTMVVSAVYVTDDPMFEKSFINSVVTVMLCSLWPTLINTSVGVANIEPDLQNVSRVLRLGRWTHIRRVVLPSSLPMIFTGLRLSLGVAWMVLIAAEMLAQNPGLGKFVWDEFQNGSSQSLARIMVAVITIGLIGFALDRIMLYLLGRVAWDPETATR